MGNKHTSQAELSYKNYTFISVTRVYVGANVAYIKSHILKLHFCSELPWV